MLAAEVQLERNLPLLLEPSFKWVTTDQEGLCLTKIGKMIKGDDSKKHSKLLPEKSLNISEAENPLLMPDPDESGEIENEEANGKVEEAKDEKGMEQDLETQEEKGMKQVEERDMGMPRETRREVKEIQTVDVSFVVVTITRKTVRTTKEESR